jgi:hypothetical protein
MSKTVLWIITCPSCAFCGSGRSEAAALAAVTAHLVALQRAQGAA